MAYDFSKFTHVDITCPKRAELTTEERGVLHQLARYCQAMTVADTDTLKKIVSETATFTHMSGRQQSREAFFSDIASGALRYFTVGIENPVVTVEGDRASVIYTSVLNADAYGARGIYRISGTHQWERRNGDWLMI